jgi:hypothetical protein
VAFSFSSKPVKKRRLQHLPSFSLLVPFRFSISFFFFFLLLCDTQSTHKDNNTKKKPHLPLFFSQDQLTRLPTGTTHPFVPFCCCLTPFSRLRFANAQTFLGQHKRALLTALQTPSTDALSPENNQSPTKVLLGHKTDDRHERRRRRPKP